jgi:hypothetical protein
MLAGKPARLGELRVGDVDPGDVTLLADLQGGEEEIGAGPAAEVDHRLARLQAGHVEEVAHARKGLDRRSRSGVEQLRVVAQSQGHVMAHLEVEVTAGAVGDGAVHVLDALLEQLGVDQVCGVHGETVSVLRDRQ